VQKYYFKSNESFVHVLVKITEMQQFNLVLGKCRTFGY